MNAASENYILTHFIPDRRFFSEVFTEWEDAWLRPANIKDTPAYAISQAQQEWEQYYNSRGYIEFMALYKDNDMIGYISYIKLLDPTPELLEETFCSGIYKKFQEPVHFIFIEAFLIRQGYRNRGYGKKLLELFHKNLDGLGLPYIVETNSENPSGRLYMSNGYEEFARVHGHRENGEDTIIYFRGVKDNE